MKLSFECDIGQDESEFMNSVVVAVLKYVRKGITSSQQGYKHPDDKEEDRKLLEAVDELLHYYTFTGEQNGS